MKQDSQIYIAGHTGFVGKTLLRTLEQTGYNCIVRPRSKLNLSDANAVNRFIFKNKPSQVYICAAHVGGIQANIQNPYRFLYENLQIQNNIIDACARAKVKKVLFLGSSCIYPKDYKQPLKEEYLLQAPIEPTNEGYALAKISGLKLCEYAGKVFPDTKFISLMPCNLYGPGDTFDLSRAHVLSSLIKKILDAKDEGLDEVLIWGTGKAKREFLYIEDLVDGMIWAMETLDKTETFLNIGTGEDIEILELAKMIADIVEYSGKLVLDTSKPDGMMKKCLDITKISSLGWRYQTPFEVGLVNTINYYRKLKDGSLS